MSPPRSKRTPELKVVFDTSVIFTGSASDLLQTKVVEVIKANSAFPDLKVTWYLPEIVVQERQYQMLRRALDLLPSIEKLELLLGHKLNITAENLKHRVSETIKAQIDSLGISVQPLEIDRVDWASLIQAAAFRKPPFEAGEKEKGFRDSIVIETFLQLVAASPVTPKVCLVGMVTGDKLIAETVRDRTPQASNVRVLETLEGLTGLINTLVADVDEEFVNRLIPKALKLFFLPKEKGTLFYSQKLSDKLEEQFKAELAALPTGATSRTNSTWSISAPRFVRKERQRVFWTSRITVEATAFASVPLSKVESPPSSWPVTLSAREWPSRRIVESLPSPWAGTPSARELPSRTIWEAIPSGPPIAIDYATWVSSGLSVENKEIAKGKTILEVDWSVSVSTSMSLSAPRIERLRFVETVWDL
jgi:hypothetical protein